VIRIDAGCGSPQPVTINEKNQNDDRRWPKLSIEFHEITPFTFSFSVVLRLLKLAKFKNIFILQILHRSRGRNAGYPAPPAQIPAYVE
jgi:hypothetical protein